MATHNPLNFSPPYGVPLVSNSISPSATHQISSSPKTTFKAPAHKHAHHLHSIPPREKSTRTLIMDHMLWVHGRTRFAQARAELGMTDRTGGSFSPNYVHRQRPENFEEEDEAQSDGEEVNALMAKLGGSRVICDEERSRSHDFSLARNLRLRAESVEKVITSMLDQPPAIHPMTDDDLLTLPTSPQIQPQSNRRDRHPHTLPNGVRLRLALGTVINDLFSRADLLPPDQKRRQPDAKSYSSESLAMPASEPISNPALPTALTPLMTISLISSTTGHTFLPPAMQNSSALPSSADYSGYLPVTAQLRPSSSLTAHAHSLYATGVRNKSVSRCPRHLRTACQICVEANVRSVPTRGRVSMNNNDPDSRHGFVGITGWKDGSGIGSGLARPGPDGTVLRRMHFLHNDGTASGTAKLSELIPRFLRLSALVATELASEASGDMDYSSDEPSDGRESERKPTSDRESSSPSIRRGMQGQNRIALQPSSRWYMLFAGLLTRAVLEGYLVAGWTGSEAAECLLTLGFGIPDLMMGITAEKDGGQNEGRDDHQKTTDESEEFDPDELPSLEDAARILFPSSDIRERKDGVAGEFQAEMEDRLRKFYDIPATTPSLSTHLEDLAFQYPVEPVERAAVRFCEAVAKWRGKPELETYKKKLSRSNDAENAGGSGIAMEAFVHSSPVIPTMGLQAPSALSTSHEANLRRPPIEKYFMPTQFSGLSKGKRTRSPSDLRLSSARRPFR